MKSSFVDLISTSIAFSVCQLYCLCKRYFWESSWIIVVITFVHAELIIHMLCQLDFRSEMSVEMIRMMYYYSSSLVRRLSWKGSWFLYVWGCSMIIRNELRYPCFVFVFVIELLFVNGIWWNFQRTCRTCFDLCSL